MSRRTLASAVVACLLLVLASVAAFLPVPYVTMSPGPTVDVLAKAKDDSKQIITVSGQKTYPTEGDLRLTTVSVTNPAQKVHLVSVLGAWFDATRAVYPRDVIYPPDKSAEESEQESSVEMVSSQDTSIAAALGELGYKLPLQIEVLAVTKGSPAAGQLRVRDKILEINGVPIRGIGQVTKAVQQTGVGRSATFVVRRGSTDETVELTAEASEDDPDKAVVGVQIGTGYDFPFDVSVRLDRDIGGPSAGLIFSLGVYDKLTPGPLSGGNDIAGTGTITAAGRVGPIGGIQQKIVAAAAAGAKIFLVPAANCESARHADVKKGEIRLVKAATLHSAVTSLEAYAEDPSADLPACG